MAPCRPQDVRGVPPDPSSKRPTGPDLLSRRPSAPRSPYEHPAHIGRGARAPNGTGEGTHCLESPLRQRRIGPRSAVESYSQRLSRDRQWWFWAAERPRARTGTFRFGAFLRPGRPARESQHEHCSSRGRGVLGGRRCCVWRRRGRGGVCSFSGLASQVEHDRDDEERAADHGPT